MDFDAGVIVQGQVLDDLLSEGYSQLPTQWIETDKKDHLKRDGQYHVPDLKSRLCGRGDLEGIGGLRCESPHS